MGHLLINAIIMAVVIFAASYVAGNFITLAFKCSRGLSDAVSLGFAANFILFSLCALPAIYLDMSFRRLAFIYGIVFACWMIFCIAGVLFFKEKNNSFLKWWSELRKNPLFYIFIVIVALQIFLSCYMQHADADDGYYVTISTIAWQQDRIVMDKTVYDGIASAGSFLRPGNSTWELFIALIALVFRIHPAILAHSFLPAVLIILCYMAVWHFAKKLFNNQNKLVFFMIIYGLLNIFGGYSGYSSGCFMLLRIWQGKALIPNLAFPLLLASVYEIYKGRKGIAVWIFNMLLVFAGMCFSVVGSSLMPLAYLSFGAPLIIKKLVTKKVKEGVSLVIKAALFMLPVVLLLIFYVYTYASDAAGSGYMSAAAPTWKEILKKTFPEGYIWALFIVAFIVIVILWKRNKEAGLLFAGTTAFTGIIYLNPLFSTFIAQKLTGVDVYWRTYWIVPFYIMIAYAGGLLFAKRIVPAILGILWGVLVCISGKYMYVKDLHFTAHDNLYKVPTEAVLAADYLKAEDENPVCLFPESISYCIRQYDPDIVVIKARAMSCDDTMIGESGKDYAWLYNKIYVEGNVESGEVQDALHTLGVEYIFYTEDMTPPEGSAKIQGSGYLYTVS